jgi:lipopolysaccharide/colanic/teichoic acid biosynthesis glycosyltransferase
MFTKKSAQVISFNAIHELTSKPSLLISIKKWHGNYILSPFFLLSSVFVFLFVPEGLLKKGLSTYIKELSYRFIKRTFDLVCAIIGLIFSAIFFWWVPIIIKLDSKGPIIYKQIRIGINRRDYTKFSGWALGSKKRRNGDRRRINVHGKPFTLYKFRTMNVNAESDTGPIWATLDDPRVTRVGKWLRNTHLDEIPQFINILKGDMSLVGPRPERPFIVYQLSKKIMEYPKRFAIKPGIAGLAQLKNGYDFSESDVRLKIKYDLKYINNNSIFMDLKILLLTFKELIFSRNGGKE